MSKPNKTFIVLGMHRSATSLIAGALHKHGVNMGDQMLGAGRGNEKGHFEDKDFMRMNIQLMGGDKWKNPDVKLKDIDTSELIKSKNVSGLWGWKDPRTALTIERYIDHIDDPIIVTSFRRPQEVAKSLHRRDGADIKQAEKLARAYNKRILDFLYKYYT